VRVFGHNGLGIHYVESRRTARYDSRPDRYQTVGTFSLTYTFLSDTGFGAVGSHQ
jgi:hypothetical protein